MAEPHPGAELGQAGVGRGRRRVGADPEPGGGPPHQRRVAGRVGRREQQQAPGLVRERADAPAEALLDAARQRHRAGEPEPAGQLGRRQSAWQLQQRQRVAPRLGDDLVAHPRVDRPGQHRVQQRPRVGVPQPADRQLRQPGQVAARRPGPRRPGRPTPPPGGGRRTRGPAPRRGRATARRRPGRPAAAPRRPRTAGSARPGRPGTGPAPARRSCRTRSAARPAAAPADASRRSSIGAHSWCSPANASSISDWTPAARATRQPGACPAR